MALVLLPFGQVGLGQTDSVSGAVAVNPLSVNMEIRPTTTRTGQRSTVRARVYNDGSNDLSAVTVQLRLDDESGLELITEATQSIGSLPGNRFEVVRWQVCGSETGSYVIVVQAQATDSNGSLLEVESEAQILTVVPGNQTC